MALFVELKGLELRILPVNTAWPVLPVLISLCLHIKGVRRAVPFLDRNRSKVDTYFIPWLSCQYWITKKDLILHLSVNFLFSEILIGLYD